MTPSCSLARLGAHHARQHRKVQACEDCCDVMSEQHRHFICPLSRQDASHWLNFKKCCAVPCTGEKCLKHFHEAARVAHRGAVLCLSLLLPCAYMWNTPSTSARHLCRNAHLWAATRASWASAARRLAASISACLARRSTPDVRMPASSRSSCGYARMHSSPSKQHPILVMEIPTYKFYLVMKCSLAEPKRWLDNRKPLMCCKTKGMTDGGLRSSSLTSARRAWDCSDMR